MLTQWIDDCEVDENIFSLAISYILLRFQEWFLVKVSNFQSLVCRVVVRLCGDVTFSAINLKKNSDFFWSKILEYQKALAKAFKYHGMQLLLISYSNSIGYLIEIIVVVNFPKSSWWSKNFWIFKN